MLAAATLLFAPVLAAGEIFGQPVSGAVAPVGVSMFFGAFLFGIGMQLGGGCGSGTLYAVGGGSPRMLLVLTAFCGGGFWASLHMGAWQSLPEWEPQALGERFGWTVTALVQAGGWPWATAPVCPTAATSAPSFPVSPPPACMVGSGLSPPSSDRGSASAGVLCSAWSMSRPADGPKRSNPEPRCGFDDPLHDSGCNPARSALDKRRDD